MATIDTVVQELVVNTLTHKQFKAAQEAGTLSPYELYGTPDTSVRLPVLTPMWFDHITNDVSWLRADTFSWQSGDVYKAAYEHLVDDLESSTISNNVALVVANGIEYYRNESSDVTGAVAYPYAWSDSSGTTYYSNVENLVVGNSLSSSTSEGGAFITVAAVYHEGYDNINDIKIEYYAAPDGHKICLPDQESNISALYEQTGVAWYYILDTQNKRFKLPRSKHNKYADTVPVVGNGMNLGLTDGSTNIGFGFKTQDQSLKGRTDFYGKDVGTDGGLGGVASAAASGNSFGVTTDPEKSGVIAQQNQDTDQYKYLYFYVGNFTQDAVEQTAGINAELFNGKADLDLGNLPTNYDYVVESQMPTSENSYTWYRKYKSGWIEQGGINNADTIVLPIEMSNTGYAIFLQPKDTQSNWAMRCYNITTTGFLVQTNASQWHDYSWQVSGYVA